jgi:hypothetical protein
MKKLTSLVLMILAAVSAVSAQDRAHWNWNDGWKHLRVESRGRIELTDDERDVKSVSPDGYFEISSRGWWSLFGQRYVVHGNVDGSTTRRFTVGAAERPLDAETRAWIGDSIQRLARSGFGAESRVARILANQGPSGVLDAISLSSSDFVKAKYFILLFSQAHLDRPAAERAIRQSGREIGSDFELARVLTAAVEALPLDQALAPAFLDAANAIGSDYQHTRVLLALLARQQTPVAVEVALDSSSHIGSDYQHARILGQVAQQKDLTEAALVGVVRGAESIGSDYEKSRVLLQVVAAHPIGDATRQALLDTAGRIRSDHERGRVLSAMLRDGTLR